MDKKEVVEIAEKVRSLIPKGIYCYDNNGNCPFWYMHDLNEDIGGCLLLGVVDGDSSGVFLLWDQCKECCFNRLTDDDIKDGLVYAQ